jgi:hypothetical protein
MRPEYGEMERIKNKAAMARFTVLFCNSLAGTERNREEQNQISRFAKTINLRHFKN